MGLMKKFMMRKVKKVFREKFGEELPIDMEQLQEMFKVYQKSRARDGIVYAVVLELGQAFIKPERLAEIMKNAVVTSTEETDVLKGNIEAIITTLAIVQGMNAAEEQVAENEVETDG